MAMAMAWRARTYGGVSIPSARPLRGESDRRSGPRSAAVRTCLRRVRPIPTVRLRASVSSWVWLPVPVCLRVSVQVPKAVEVEEMYPSLVPFHSRFFLVSGCESHRPKRLE
jgi:hypothetical protein